MASIFLPFDEGTLVKDLPRVCASCGAPATQSDKVTFWRNEREATVRVPLCGRHPLMGWFWPALLLGFLVLAAVMGASALVDRFVPRLLLIIPFNFLLSFWLVALFYLALTEVGCGGIDSGGVRLTRVSRQFVRAVEQHEGGRSRRSRNRPLPSEGQPAVDGARERGRRRRPRSRGPLDLQALGRELAIIGGISLGVFALITARHVLPALPQGGPPQPPRLNEQPAPQGPQADKQPEKPPELPPPDVPPPATDFPGLLAYWPFEGDPRERAADRANKGNDGKCEGATPVEGVRGKALAFGKDAFFGYGTGPGLDFPADGAFTTAFWVKTTSASGVLISQRHSRDVGSLIEAFLAGGRLQVHVRRNELPWRPEDVISKSLVNDGRWHHCAFLRSGETVEIYVDGTREAKVVDKNAAGPITTDLRAVGQEGCWVLGKKGPERGFTGAVDEFCVFGRALRPEEVKALAGR